MISCPPSLIYNSLHQSQAIIRYTIDHMISCPPSLVYNSLHQSQAIRWRPPSCSLTYFTNPITRTVLSSGDAPNIRVPWRSPITNIHGGTWTQHGFWTLLLSPSQFFIFKFFQNFHSSWWRRQKHSRNTLSKQLKFDLFKLNFDFYKISDFSTFFYAFFRTEPKGLTAESKVHRGPKCQLYYWRSFMS
jgi:hypothetical protein